VSFYNNISDLPEWKCDDDSSMYQPRRMGDIGLYTCTDGSKHVLKVCKDEGCVCRGCFFKEKLSYSSIKQTKDNDFQYMCLKNCTPHIIYKEVKMERLL